MKALVYFLLIAGTLAYAKESTKIIKVAVIDTGLNLKDSRFEDHVCPHGSKDFTGTGLDDVNGHGTFVAGLIKKYAGHGNYCLLIYKYYVETNPGSKNLRNEVNAIAEAARNGADIINFSSGGPDFDENEYLSIAKNPNIIFVVASGNESQNLDIPGSEYYPASYPLENIIRVGNIDQEGFRVPSSNWGSKVTDYEIGKDVVSTLPNGEKGTMTGTSFSTAIRTGKIVRNMTYAK